MRGRTMSTQADHEVRRLEPDDATALVLLRREALDRHPLAFSASPEDDRGLSIDFVRASLGDGDRSVIFGLAGAGAARLAGMVGLYRAAEVKRQHHAHIWGMYVAPEARGRGAGRALLEAAIAQARAWPGVEEIGLSVSDSATEAHALYRAAGFTEWGRERRALTWQGRFVDQIHMTLNLGGTAADAPADPP